MTLELARVPVASTHHLVPSKRSNQKPRISSGACLAAYHAVPSLSQPTLTHERSSSTDVVRKWVPVVT